MKKLSLFFMSLMLCAASVNAHESCGCCNDAVECQELNIQQTRGQQESGVFEKFEEAILQGDSQAVHQFLTDDKRDTNAVRSLLNDQNQEGIPGLLALIHLADQKADGTQLIEDAVACGADVTKVFISDQEKADGQLESITPLEFAILLSFFSCNTRIVRSLCEHGALEGMTIDALRELIDNSYENVSKNYEEIVAVQVEDEEENNHFREQFKEIHDELQKMFIARD